MRVAIIKSNKGIDTRISRILGNDGINGDIISKFTRSTLNEYDYVIFTYQNSIPNIPKVLEKIVFEKQISVIYITKTASIGQFYNLLDDLYFNFVQEYKMDLVLSTIIMNSRKYLKQIRYYKLELDRVENDFETLKLNNKAKRILINKGLSEADSHKFIIKKSMEMRISKKKLANLIIEQRIDI